MNSLAASFLPLRNLWQTPSQSPTTFPKKLSTWLIAFAPPMLWAGLIYTLSAQSSLQSIESSTLDFFFKKLAHVTVYAVLFTLIHRGFRLILPQYFHSKYPTAHWLIPVVVVAIYAITDEFHQSFVPGRYATLKDIGFDLLGVLIALLRQYRYI
jgi:VanZ family protein